MAPKGSISLSLTRRDFEDFAVFAALEGPFARTIVFRRMRMLLLCAAAFLLLLLLVFDLDLSVIGSGLGDVSPWARSAVLALAAAVAAAWICLPFAVRAWVRRGISSPQYDSLLQPTQLSLSNAGIACDNASGETVTAWQAIKAIAVFNAAIYAFIAPFQAIIIPRRAFADSAACGDFVTALSSHQARAGADWTLTKVPGSPRRVIAASVLGVLGALILVAACLYYVGTTKAFYIATFDLHLKGAPVEAALIEADPALRDRVLRAASEAFAVGGWDAANEALWASMGAKQSEISWTYVVFADDQLLVGLWRAYLDVGKALAGDPATCRSYLNDGGNAPPDFPGVKATAARRDAAERSGVANLVGGKAPTIPADPIGRSLFDRAAAIGVPYSAAEWDVIAHQAGALRTTPDAVVCTARIKYFDKISSLPHHDAAQLIRYEWAQPLARKFSATTNAGG